MRCEEIPFLDYLISNDGLKEDPEKIKAVLGMPAPTDVTSMRRFVA